MPKENKMIRLRKFRKLGILGGPGVVGTKEIDIQQEQNCLHGWKQNDLNERGSPAGLGGAAGNAESQRLLFFEGKTNNSRRSVRENHF